MSDISRTDSKFIDLTNDPKRYANRYRKVIKYIATELASPIANLKMLTNIINNSDGILLDDEKQNCEDRLKLVQKQITTLKSILEHIYYPINDGVFALEFIISSLYEPFFKKLTGAPKLTSLESLDKTIMFNREVLNYVFFNLFMLAYEINSDVSISSKREITTKGEYLICDFIIIERETDRFNKLNTESIFEPGIFIYADDSGIRLPLIKLILEEFNSDIKVTHESTGKTVFRLFFKTNVKKPILIN